MISSKLSSTIIYISARSVSCKWPRLNLWDWFTESESLAFDRKMVTTWKPNLGSDIFLSYGMCTFVLFYFLVYIGQKLLVEIQKCCSSYKYILLTVLTPSAQMFLLNAETLFYLKGLWLLSNHKRAVNCIFKKENSMDKKWSVHFFAAFSTYHIDGQQKHVPSDQHRNTVLRQHPPHP